jgi:predicted MFS family arabinose efflux permease
MNQNETNSSVALFYLMRFVGAGTMIFIPIVIPFLRSHGLSWGDIALLALIFGLTGIVVELPTGRLADLIGRKWALVIGRLMMAASFACYASSETLVGFAFAEALLGAGVAFGLGADEALLRSLYPSSDCGGAAFSRAWSRSLVIDFMGGALFMLLAPTLFQLAPELPLKVAAGACVIGAMLASTMGEPRRAARNGSSMIAVTKLCLIEREGLRSLILFQAAVWSLLAAVILLYEPLLRHLGVSREIDGAIFAIGGIVAGIASFVTPAIVRRIDIRSTKALMLIGMALGFVLLGVIDQGWVAILIMLPQFARGVLPVVVGTAFNAAMDDDIRATALSVRNMVVRMGDCAGKGVGLLLAGEIGVAGTFLVLGSILLLALAINWLLRERLRAAALQQTRLAAEVGPTD